MSATPVGVASPRRRAAAEWPGGGTLDLAAIEAGGWTASPIRQFLLKVTSRCNLDCDYCYVYHQADQSWREKPRLISPEVTAQVAARVAEHVVAHELQAVSVIFHGGEPLLLGLPRLRAIAEQFRAAVPAGVRLQFGMQTNATLLTDELVEFLVAERFGVGISLDGGEGANDRHRLDRRGRSSYADARRGLELLQRSDSGRALSGLLSTIDLSNAPIETYDDLVELGAPSLDFLLPHGTWTAPPPGLDPNSAATPYADWLIPVFDRWFDAPVKAVRMRFFEEIIHLLLGGTTALELLGLEPVRLVVVESDGTIEQVDSLKAAYDGAASTGLNVTDHSFDDVLRQPAFAARQIGMNGVAEACRACDLVTVCGGGLYTHRYREGDGFLNPSVYCRDLYRLIDHIRASIDRAVARQRALRLQATA